MKRIINFFIRLWRIITGREARPYIINDDKNVVPVKKQLLDTISYDFDIDYTDIYDTIERCKTIKNLQKECKLLGITINTNIHNLSGDKTVQLKSKYLYELLKVYSEGVLQKYKQMVTVKLQEIKPLMERRIKDLRLHGLKYDSDIDYVDIYNTLINCKTYEGLQKECKERGIMINTDVRNISPDKTIQLKCEELLALLKLFGQGASEPFKKALETKIEEFELLKNKRIEELQAQGICCPKCFNKQKKYYTGLLVWELYTKANTGYGGVGFANSKEETQFHYVKCSKCGEWKMFEYRETPGWFDDLFDRECPWIQGDMIAEVSEDWENGKMEKRNIQYKGYQILRW